MPGAISGQLSGKLPVQLINIFKSASSIPNDVLEALASKSRDSNVILPCLLDSLAKEKSGQIPAHDQVWITCTSYDRQPTVDLVLSCTEGPMGSYPIFIVSLRPFASLTHQYLLPRLIALASALHDTVPVNRVYSVFAPEPITMLFVSLWTELTGVGSYAREPYYAAKLSYCTKSSFSNRQTTIHPDLVYDLRPADDDDIMDVAELCHNFAAVSVSYSSFYHKKFAYFNKFHVTSRTPLCLHQTLRSKKPPSSFARNKYGSTASVNLMELTAK
jgi:hypothetical protein